MTTNESKTDNLGDLTLQYHNIVIGFVSGHLGTKNDWTIPKMYTNAKSAYSMFCDRYLIYRDQPAVHVDQVNTQSALKE